MFVARKKKTPPVCFCSLFFGGGARERERRLEKERRELGGEVGRKKSGQNPAGLVVMAGQSSSSQGGRVNKKDIHTRTLNNKNVTKPFASTWS